MNNQQMNNQQTSTQPNTQLPPLQSSPTQLEQTTRVCKSWWYYPFIPTFTLLGLVQGRIGWRALSSYQWRFWLTITILCYLTINHSPLVFLFQRSLNIFREVCFCDAIRLIRSVDLIEGAFIVTSSYGNTLKYLTCRSLCF